MKSNNTQSGQVLLIIVLISAVLLTVGLSITQIGTTDTKVTKLEEENKKALAAAEAGLEVALQQGGADIADLLPKGSHITGTADTDTTTKPDFVSPLVKKDALYTFYLAEYVKGEFNNYYNNNLLIYFQSNAALNGRQNALEITIIRSDNTKSEKIIVDPNIPRIKGSIAPMSLTPPTVLPDYQDTTFNYSYRIDQSNIDEIKLLLIRTLNGDSRIGLQAVADPSCMNCSTTLLPFQGKTVTSTAQTDSGVTKKIELFQSYPQIPSDFFITSF